MPNIWESAPLLDRAQPNLELRATTEPPLRRAAPLPNSGELNQDFSWVNVEVQIDANVLQSGTLWMTMLDLMHDGLTLCHWNQFKLQTLHRQLEAETGVVFNSANYEFVYCCFDGMSFHFNNPGAYKIMLKRFEKVASTTNNILHLKVERRETM